MTPLYLGIVLVLAADPVETRADEFAKAMHVTPDAENVVQSSPQEQAALNEYWSQAALIPRHDIPVKKLAAVKDGQLQRALDVLTRQCKD